MYIVKNIVVEDDKYISSSIIASTNEGILKARELLQNCAQDYVIEQYGKKRECQVQEVQKLQPNGEVCLLQLIEEPHEIHLYCEKEIIVPGWFSNGTQKDHKRQNIFELEETVQLTKKNETATKVMPVRSSNINTPKVDITDLLEELTQGARFLSIRKSLDDELD